MVKLSFGEFNGDLWEELCQQCFKYKYSSKGYQRIPADACGDLGIEGYTRDGLVFQCYCPDEDYPPKELYEHQRDKITKDLKKLIKNKDKLINDYLGDIKIRIWYFVTPFYKNKELLEHCNKKKMELRQKKLPHLAPDFDILILEATDFTIEINHIIRVDKRYKLNFSVAYEKKDTDWFKCSSKLVKNLIRKISAIVPDPTSEAGLKNINRVVQIYMDYYLKGFKLLNLLQSQYLDMYEKLISIRSMYESNVEVRCSLNVSGYDNNRELFYSLIEDFGKVLKEEFNDLFETEMIEALKYQIISSWLLECPMDFR